jgi:hypothetical protein
MLHLVELDVEMWVNAIHIWWEVKALLDNCPSFCMVYEVVKFSTLIWESSVDKKTFSHLWPFLSFSTVQIGCVMASEADRTFGKDDT